MRSRETASAWRGGRFVQSHEADVASLEMLAADHAARHRACDRHTAAIYAGALSVLLHLVLLVLLSRLDVRPGELRLLPPASEPVLLSEWTHDRKIVREAPADILVPGAASIAVRVEPPRFELTDLSVPALDHAPAKAADTAADSAATPPEPANAGTETLTPASFADGQQQSMAAPLEEAIPEPRKVAIDPQQQVMLVERVADVARTLQDGRPAEFEWRQDGQRYRAVLTRRSGVDSMDFESVLVDITTKGRSGASMQTQLTLKRLAFSQFTQFIDRWDSNVQLHDDEIIGRFHSNSSFLVLHDTKAAPMISGVATTAARDVNVAASGPRRRRAHEMFQGGLEVRARRVALPDRARPLLTASLDPLAHVHRFREDTHLTLHAGGRYTWRTQDTDTAGEGVYAEDHPTYFVGAPGVTLFVKGVVDGRVLVYARERIVIEGQLRYADDPRVSLAADDFLGLVSDKFIVVAPPDVTGPGDLYVDAAIFARRGFRIADIDSPRGGTLSIYGSLTAGTMSASEPRYATRVEFDSRLDRVRPPGFPTTDRYEVASWEAQWDELEADRTPLDRAADEGWQAHDSIVATQVPQ
jgi:hypothetical protein